MKWVQPWSFVSLIGASLMLGFWAEPSGAQDAASTLPADRSDAALAKWLKTGDLESLTNLDDALWLTQWMLPRGIASSKFSVRWTGTITAPAEGAYTFSTTPINVNVREESFQMQQAMAVWVGDQQVLDATAKKWASQGTPVTLKAGTPTPIRVEYSFESFGQRFDSQPAIALLFWEGPGLSQALVPSDVLTTAAGEKGLKAEYRLVVGDEKQEQVVAQLEPNIDHFWVPKDPIVPEDAALRRRLGARLGTLLLDPAYLERCAKGERELVWQEVRLLDSAGRRALFQTLMTRPALLVRLPRNTIGKLTAFCRAAAREEVLDVAGGFAQAHPYLEPAFALKPDQYGFQGLAKLILQDLEQLPRLEERYLVLPDGQCSLTMACTLLYVYWGEGRVDEWIAKLDARLADPSTTGDKRVNWLIARAQAEEVRGSRPGRGLWAQERLLAGQSWLEEACLVAQSEPMRLRGYRELAARMVGNEDVAGATKLLDTAAKRFSQPKSTAALAQWRTEIAAVDQQVHQQKTEQETTGQDAYHQALERRRARAAKQNN
jgi:hypothetical protein